MTSDPRVTHLRDMGGTNDVFKIRAKLQRSATLDEELRTVTARSDGQVILVIHDGFPDKRQQLVIQPESARALAGALLDAADDVAEESR